MRTIDADALKKDIELQTDILLAIKVDPKLTQIAKIMRNGFIAQVDKMPTVEPERKTGKWVWRRHDEETGIDNSHWCSVCGQPMGQISENYCAVCGAKMEPKWG